MSILKNATDSIALKDEVYQKAKRECYEKIESLCDKTIANAIVSYGCENCDSELIYPLQENSDDLYPDFICKSCGAKYSYQNIVPLAIDYLATIESDAEMDKLKS